MLQQVAERVSDGLITSGSFEVLDIRDHHREGALLSETVGPPQQEGWELKDLNGLLALYLSLAGPLCHGGQVPGGDRHGPRLWQILPPVDSRRGTKHAQLDTTG